MEAESTGHLIDEQLPHVVERAVPVAEVVLLDKVAVPLQLRKRDFEICQRFFVSPATGRHPLHKACKKICSGVEREQSEKPDNQAKEIIFKPESEIEEW